MTGDRRACFFLESGLRERAAARQHPFMEKMANILENSQFRVEFREHGDFADARGAYSLSHMKEPPNSRGLVFRRAYEYPFWQIDCTGRRWDWDVARNVFDPNTVPMKDAEQFYRFWRKRLYDDAPQKTERGGFVYVPLQGRLTRHRSFQTCSPLEMIEYCVAHSGHRKVIATLHPEEEYSATERTALETLVERYSRLSVEAGGMVPLLQACDYVVTQNSSAAFAGYFFAKPALLFAKIDFHHIGIKAKMDDLPQSFAEAAAHRPDFARYLWWFWQDQSINAGRDTAEAKIAERLKRFGWPID